MTDAQRLTEEFYNGTAEKDWPAWATEAVAILEREQPMPDSPLSGARPTSKKDEGLGTGSGDRGREE